MGTGAPVPHADPVTDLRGWALSLYVAGPVDGRPVVVEAHGWGPPLDVPDIALDPEDSTVLIAEVPMADGERPAVVLQTPDGAVLHRPVDDDWFETRLPPGHADAALLVDDGTRGVTAYAVVDGRLWWRALP